MEKNVDGVLGTRTQGGRMDSVDESTELWRHPLYLLHFQGFVSPYLLTYLMEVVYF